MKFICYCGAEFEFLQDGLTHLTDVHNKVVQNKGFIRIKHSYGSFHCNCEQNSAFTSESCAFDYYIKSPDKGFFKKVFKMACEDCERMLSPRIMLNGARNLTQIHAQCFWKLQLKGDKSRGQKHRLKGHKSDLCEACKTKNH